MRLESGTNDVNLLNDTVQLFHLNRFHKSEELKGPLLPPSLPTDAIHSAVKVTDLMH